MDVEGVAPRGAVRPSRFGERIPADHGPVTLEQCRRESRLDGRQRHPARPGAQNTVVVELGRALDARLHLVVQVLDTSMEVDPVGRVPYPVLALIRGPGRGRTAFH